MATRTAHDQTGRDAPDSGDLQAITLRVAKVLALIRPAIQRDGGDVELIEVTGSGLVRIRLLGACIGCPSAAMTLKYGIEQNLRDHVPGVSGVEAVE
jgi:Fe-S cluster biogenesis protein NfuA